MSCCGRCKVCRHEWEELEARIEELLDIVSDARPYLTNARFMNPTDEEVEITSRMDRELDRRRASNPSDQRANAQEEK